MRWGAHVVVLCVTLAVLTLRADAAVDADLVTEIPGLATPFPQRIWSGYIEVPTVNGSVSNTIHTRIL
jgi:hypothetical protein